jgi:hypothetical protein
MTFNISTVREQPSKLVDVIQQTVKRSSKPRRITLGNDSAILCEVVVLVNGSGIRLDLTDNNFSPPKIMPSKMLISVYTRQCNDNKNVSDIPTSKITDKEIEEGVNKLIQIIDTMSFPTVSQTYQECCVCLEMTNKITKCNHAVCNVCCKKIEAICEDKIEQAEYEMGGEVDWDDIQMPCCPMCRKMM